jgi:hypothetical protein
MSNIVSPSRTVNGCSYTCPENVAPRHRVVKKVFAGLQCALRMPPRVNLKRQFAAHHSIFFQQIGNVSARRPMWHVNKHTLLREALVRLRHAVPHPRRSATSNQHNQQQ